MFKGRKVHYRRLRHPKPSTFESYVPSMDRGDGRAKRIRRKAKPEEEKGD